MLAKGRMYVFKSDDGCIELEDSETGELLHISNQNVFLFDVANQVRYIRNSICIKPTESILCIQNEPPLFGVSEIYYPDDNIASHTQQRNVVKDIFPTVTDEEVQFLHKLLIPHNLSNESIDNRQLFNLFTNFIKQSLSVFTGSVYESNRSKTDREIGLKIVFGIDAINYILKRIIVEKPIVEQSENEIRICYGTTIIASYKYSDNREEGMA